MNKRTWIAAAAVFAYGFATLAELGYNFVGMDQLVGGTWPDNEAFVINKAATPLEVHLKGVYSGIVVGVGPGNGRKLKQVASHGLIVLGTFAVVVLNLKSNANT